MSRGDIFIFFIRPLIFANNIGPYFHFKKEKRSVMWRKFNVNKNLTSFPRGYLTKTSSIFQSSMEQKMIQNYFLNNRQPNFVKLRRWNNNLYDNFFFDTPGNISCFITICWRNINAILSQNELKLILNNPLCA